MNLLILSMLLLFVPMPPENPPPADLNKCEQTMLQDVNKQRAAHGLRPVVIDKTLQDGCRNHTIWMGRHRALRHARKVNENIAMGQRDTNEVIRTWMNSSGHRANILNRRWTKVGVCGYRIGGTFWWTQRFR